MKICNGCNTEKELSEFHKRTLSSGNISTSHICKSCVKLKSAARYADKSEHIKRINKEWRDNNKDYYHSRYLNNKDTYLQWLRDYNLENPHKAKERSRIRRVRRKDAFVNWANSDSISAIYAMSRFLTDVVGVQYHVDHVIPLQGKTVCGLHVENNLAIVTATHNLKKGSKYD